MNAESSHTMRNICLDLEAMELLMPLLGRETGDGCDAARTLSAGLYAVNNIPSVRSDSTAK